MRRDVITVDPTATFAETARRLREHGISSVVVAERRIRHLPVVDKGRLVGMISIRDLTTWAVQELTGGHELPDLERSSAPLSAAVAVDLPH